jgi:hypothetical protein
VSAHRFQLTGRLPYAHTGRDGPPEHATTGTRSVNATAPARKGRRTTLRPFRITVGDDQSRPWPLSALLLIEMTLPPAPSQKFLMTDRCKAAAAHRMPSSCSTDGTREARPAVTRRTDATRTIPRHVRLITESDRRELIEMLHELGVRSPSRSADSRHCTTTASSLTTNMRRGVSDSQNNSDDGAHDLRSQNSGGTVALIDRRARQLARCWMTVQVASASSSKAAATRRRSWRASTPSS